MKMKHCKTMDDKIVIFSSNMLQHKQKVVIENVYGKMKQFSILSKTKMATM